MSSVVSLFGQYLFALSCSVKLHVLLATTLLSVRVPQGSCSNPVEAQVDWLSAQTHCLLVTFHAGHCMW